MPRGPPWPHHGPTWQAGRPRRRTASSMHGRSSRMRLAVWTISTAQAAGSTGSDRPRAPRPPASRGWAGVALRARRGCQPTASATTRRLALRQVGAQAPRPPGGAPRALRLELLETLAPLRPKPGLGDPETSRTFSTWPSTRTRGNTLRTIPSPSMTKVERIIPMTFFPYMTFSPNAPYFLATAFSESLRSGKFSFSWTLNFSWDASESGLTPRTTTPRLRNFAMASRNPQASLVHPGVLSSG